MSIFEKIDDLFHHKITENPLKQIEQMPIEEVLKLTSNQIESLTLDQIGLITTKAQEAGIVIDPTEENYDHRWDKFRKQVEELLQTEETM